MRLTKFALVAGLACALLPLLPIEARAADNVLVTPCLTGCVTMRTKEISAGLHSSIVMIGDTSGTPLNLQVDGSNFLKVNVAAGGTPLGPVAGSASLPVVGANDWFPQVRGNVASAASDSGEPVKIGGLFLTTQATVTNSQRVNAAYSNRGAAIVVPGVEGFAVTVSGVSTATNQATEIASLASIDTKVGSPVPACVASPCATIIGNVAGPDAAGASVTNNPFSIAGVARTSEPTAVTNAQTVRAIFDIMGKQIVLPYANPENFVSGAITTSMVGTTPNSLIPSPGGSLRNYVTTIVCSNAHATVGTDIAIQDGSGGTTLMTIPAAAVYGGAAFPLPTPLRQPTTATALFAANVTTGASTKCSAVGYKGV